MLGNRIPIRAMESADKLLVRSALNPVLWLCGIISIPSIIAANFLTPTPWWLIFLIITPVSVAMFGFLFLLFFDRNKLQSEEYQLKLKSMELIQEKGQEEPTLVNSEDVQAVANPHIIQIENNQ